MVLPATAGQRDRAGHGRLGVVLVVEAADPGCARVENTCCACAHRLRIHLRALLLPVQRFSAGGMRSGSTSWRSLVVDVVPRAGPQAGRRARSRRRPASLPSRGRALDVGVLEPAARGSCTSLVPSASGSGSRWVRERVCLGHGPAPPPLGWSWLPRAVRPSRARPARTVQFSVRGRGRRAPAFCSSGGANAAISRELLPRSPRVEDAGEQVLAEALGHALDARRNRVDSASGVHRQLGEALLDYLSRARAAGRPAGRRGRRRARRGWAPCSRARNGSLRTISSACVASTCGLSATSRRFRRSAW